MVVGKPLKQVILSGALIGAAAVAAHFIMPFEGIKHKAYRDGGGVWTICRGHTKGVHEGDIATDPQCDQWYNEDITAAQNTYDQMVRRDNPRNVKAASISFIFNTGAGKFARSTLRAKLDTGGRAEICNQFLRWKYQGPLNCSLPQNYSTCGGLWIRRQQERALCLDDKYYSSYALNENGAVIGVNK